MCRANEEMCRVNGEMCRADEETCRGDGIENSRGDGENGNAIGENGIALPYELLGKCKNLKKWESSKKMKSIVLELCTFMPLSLSDIAKIINRKPNSVRYLYVNPLIESGELFYTIPEMLNHPNQKYTAVKNK